jgi:uncharacterized damage-inducible protein DinB
LLPAALTAQESDAAIASRLYNEARANVLASARLVSAENYAFRPTDEVRTFGQLVAHIADAQFFFCSSALGVPNPNEPDHRPGIVAPESLEATRRGKPEIVAAAEAAFAYCDDPFARMSDGELAARTPLLLSLYHMASHYGNMVIYLRLLGHIPPSTAS